MKRLFVVPIALLGLTGCYDPYAHHSRIVLEAEEAGAGNLSTFTYPGLVQWFAHRPTFAQKISGECGAIAVHASADWLTTSEGTVCRAAQITTRPPEMTADQRSW